MRKTTFNLFLVMYSFLGLLAISPLHAIADQNPMTRLSKVSNKVVFQISDSDPKKWNLTLSNALNVITELGKKNVAMEIVVYGPAIDMLRIESQVAPRIDEVIDLGVKVVACENTMRGMHLTNADMLPALHYTRSGVVYLMKKQQEGYAYIRP